MSEPLYGATVAAVRDLLSRYDKNLPLLFEDRTLGKQIPVRNHYTNSAKLRNGVELLLLGWTRRDVPDYTIERLLEVMKSYPDDAWLVAPGRNGVLFFEEISICSRPDGSVPTEVRFFFRSET